MVVCWLTSWFGKLLKLPSDDKATNRFPDRPVTEPVGEMIMDTTDDGSPEPTVDFTKP
jgi:hypothetical protein